MSSSRLIRYSSLFLLCLISSFNGCVPRGIDKLISSTEEFDVDDIHVILRTDTTAAVTSAILLIDGGMHAADTIYPESIESLSLQCAVKTAIHSYPSVHTSSAKSFSEIFTNTTGDYSYIALRGLNDRFDSLWLIFSEVIQSHTINKTVFERERAALATTTDRQLDDPAAYTTLIGDLAFLHDTRYGRRSTSEKIRAISITEAQAYITSLFQRNRLLLTVVGRIDRSALEQKIHNANWKVSPTEYNRPEGTTHIPLSPIAVFAAFPQHKLPVTYVRAYFAGPPPSSPAYYAFRRMCDWLTNSIFYRLRIKDAIAVRPICTFIDGAQPYGVISFEASDVNFAVQDIFSVVDIYRRRLLQSRHQDTREFTEQYVREQTTFYQALELGIGKILYGSYDAMLNSTALTHAVSSEDVRSIARIYLKNFCWVVVGNTSGVDRKQFLSY